MCIAPVILARLFSGIDLTTGDDPVSREFIGSTGNHYFNTSHGEVVTDRHKKIFTTPCYMLDASIGQIAEGTNNLVGEIMAFLNRN